MTDDEKTARDRIREGKQLFACWQRLLPDSRLRRPRHTIRGPLGMMEQCFCVNCGAPGGFVTEVAIDHIFYLCDECVVRHGHLPLPQIPEGG